MPMKALSVIIPARNEEALLGETLHAVLRSAGELLGVPGELPDLRGSPVEVLVVDNASTDGSLAVAAGYVAGHGVRLLHCEQIKAPCARNLGARESVGRVLAFVDADTVIPEHALRRVLGHCDVAGCQAGIARLASREPGWRARLWWSFWEHVRRLPVARAKAMPAFMFCTRAAFEEFGPFDERVAIGEEWPILAGVYRARANRFVYDRSLTALTSSRRMEMRPWGYLRTLGKYAWAIAHPSGQNGYGDHLRHRRSLEAP